MNFHINSQPIDVEKLKNIFKPLIVFDNSGITKMHDNLPLSLFSLKNFLILFKRKEYDISVFWFPIVL